MIPPKPSKRPPELPPNLLAADENFALAAVIEAGSHAEALVDFWVSERNAAAVSAVANDEKGPAVARKAARRGLNVLKARGVPLPEVKTVTRIGAQQACSYAAWFIPPDPSRTSVFMIIEKAPSGRNRLVQVAIRDEVGILEVVANNVSGSQLRARLADAERELRFPPTEVSVAWARTRIAQAHEQNSKSGAIIPLGLDAQADVLGPVPSPATLHPLDGVEPNRAPEIVAASLSLHGEPEFAAWLPDPQLLRGLLVELGEALRGGAMADPEKVDMAMRDKIAATVDQVFTPEARSAVARRMKDAAVSVQARRGSERAAEVLGVAAAILDAGLITSPPSEIPFLTGLFRKALTMLAMQSGGRLQIPVPSDEPLVDAAAPPAAAPPAEVSP